jgi:ABC-2 type transport system ATP-binding protein
MSAESAVLPAPAATGRHCAEPQIEARDLHKVYPGGVRALDGLSFRVDTGTVFALVGPNGAGKTTAVKILTTLSKPTSGQAWVGGVDVIGAPGRVRRLIGCVTQHSSVDLTATGRENLMLQGRLYRLAARELKEQVSVLLETFDLAETADRPARTYSGGMQRRLDLAMGLIHRPQVLFLDEPTVGLDPEARAALWALISGLARRESLTVLLTTHYLDEADNLAAQLAIVDRGRVVACGSPQELRGELRGDAIHAELRADFAEDLVHAALARADGVRNLMIDGNQLHAQVDDGPAAVPVLLTSLESAGIGVASVTMARPSLADVYLRYAGRSFRAADSGRSRS